MHVSSIFSTTNVRYSVVLFAVIASTCALAQTSPERWGVAIQGDGERGSRPVHLQLALVEGEPLIGTFTVDTLPPEESMKKIPPFVIEGHERGDGTFWPNVELQVKLPDGEWLKIASSLDDAVPAKVTVYSGMAIHGLLVNLEPFKNYVSQCKFGRVVLKSGEEAIVNLSHLTDRSKERKESN